MRRLTVGPEGMLGGYCIATGISVGFTRNRPKDFCGMWRFLSFVSPGKAGRGVVQPDADIGKSASRSRDHKEVRYSLQIG